MLFGQFEDIHERRGGSSDGSVESAAPYVFH